MLEGHTGAVNSISFSPDGQTIVSASADNTVRLWEAETGAEIAVLKGHTGAVNTASFSPDGQTILTASIDNTIRLWEARSGAEVARLEGYTGIATFSPSGQIIIGYGNIVRLWQIRRVYQSVLSNHTRGVFQTEFDVTGQLVVSAGNNGAQIWDSETGNLLTQLWGHGANSEDKGDQVIQSVVFSPSGQQVATAGWDGTARLWDTYSGKELQTLAGHKGRLINVAFHPSGDILATSAADTSVRLWDTTSGKTLHVISGTNYFDFSPDGALIATPGLSGTVEVWNVQTGAKQLTLIGDKETSFVQAVFSPNGTQIAAGDFHGAGYIWNAHTGEQIAKLTGHTKTIHEIAYSPDGTLIATVSADGTARLWVAQTGVERFNLQGHQLGVRSVAFSPNGRQLATGGEDGTVRLWNTQTGDLEAILPDVIATELTITWQINEEAGEISADSPENFPSFILDVNYNPSGDRLVAASLDTSVDIYVVDPRLLLDIAQSQVTRSLTCQERVQFMFEDLDCSDE
jgi:WD40 repeat protein